MLRLATLLVTAIAGLYALEFLGVVNKREYFPTLPRLEASASDPAAWGKAAQWGWERLPDLSGILPSTDPHHGQGSERFTDRVAAKNKPGA